jgi:hypothetical protein
MSEPFHEFDAYAALEHMSLLLKEIADAHNNLVNDYVLLKKHQALLERRVHHLEGLYYLSKTTHNQA